MQSHPKEEQWFLSSLITVHWINLLTANLEDLAMLFFPQTTKSFWSTTTFTSSKMCEIIGLLKQLKTYHLSRMASIILPIGMTSEDDTVTISPHHFTSLNSYTQKRFMVRMFHWCLQWKDCYWTESWANRCNQRNEFVRQNDFRLVHNHEC